MEAEGKDEERCLLPIWGLASFEWKWKKKTWEKEERQKEAEMK